MADRHSLVTDLEHQGGIFRSPGAAPPAPASPALHRRPALGPAPPCRLGRSSSVVSTSAMVLGRLTATPSALPRLADGLFLAAFSAGRSTMVFHAPQAGHFPATLGSRFRTQCSKTVFLFS